MAVPLFRPEEVIPIISTPLLEQDVIALFNQLIAAGVIRGFHVLATSSHERYDSIVRIKLENTEKYIYHEQTNPLGVPTDCIDDRPSQPLVLEYKYVLDTILSDFSKEIKFENHVDLVVAWTMGDKWKERYQIVPFLHKDYLYNRSLHGITHEVVDAFSGDHAFYAIILEELISYLEDADAIQEKLHKKYIVEDY